MDAPQTAGSPVDSRPHWQFKPGQSGNPEGRRAELRKLEANGPGPDSRYGVALTEALVSAIDAEELATWLVSLARGDDKWRPDLAAIKYIYDRLVGQTVQRHEAKLGYQVDETARILAAAYGIPVDEVLARTKALAAGT